jgi:hypothetical protein
MDLKQRLTQLDSSDYILISDIQLAELMESLKIVFKEDTMISDFIRIFKYNNLYIFQEQTPNGEIIIRKFGDKTAVDLLIQQRLNIYEKMWNGCGCKIEYFNI